MKILLSAGHGYKLPITGSVPIFDPGCEAVLDDGVRMTEHKINCTVIHYFLLAIKGKEMPFEVTTALYTKIKDAASNSHRAKTARGFDITLYVHHNSCSNPAVQRSEVLYYGNEQYGGANIILNSFMKNMAYPAQMPRAIDASEGAARGQELLQKTLYRPADGSRMRNVLCAYITEGFFLSTTDWTAPRIHEYAAKEAIVLIGALKKLCEVFNAKGA